MQGVLFVTSWLQTYCSSSEIWTQSSYIIRNFQFLGDVFGDVAFNMIVLNYPFAEWYNYFLVPLTLVTGKLSLF